MEFHKRIKLQMVLTSAFLMLAVTFLCTFFALAAQKTSVGASISIVYTAPSYILPTGTEFNKLIPTDCTTIIFDDISKSDYSSVVAAGGGTSVAPESGREPGITIFYNGTSKTMYVLTDGDIVAAEDSSSMFRALMDLEVIKFNKFNTSNVKNMSYMFAGCMGLKEADFSGFNTAKVENMNYMFGMVWSLPSIDVSKFNTANVTDMSNMFAMTGEITLNLSNFNTAKVKNMNSMFTNTSIKELDLSNFNTSKVTDMGNMFAHSAELTTISVNKNWSTTAVTSSENIFDGCENLVGGNGTKYHEDNVGIEYARYDGGKANPGYLTCSTNSTLKVGGLSKYISISECTYIEFNYRKYCTANISSVTSTDLSEKGDKSIQLYYVGTSAYILSDYEILANANSEGLCRYFQQVTEINFYNLDTRNVTTMESMFYLTGALSLDLSGFNTSKVTDMSYMFWKSSSVTRIEFGDAFDTSKVTTMSCMFDECKKLTNLDVSRFNTSNVTTMSSMFYYCESLTNLDLSNFNTSKVTNMGHMFRFCSKLTSLNVTSFDTSKVTGTNSSTVDGMNYMFTDCSDLISLDLSSFNTAKVVDMQHMFNGCYDLQSIYVGDGWSTASVTSSESMFGGQSKIVGGMGTIVDSNHTDKTYARIDGGAASPGYFINVETSRRVVGDIKDVFSNNLSSCTSIEFNYSNNCTENLASASLVVDVSDKKDNSVQLYVFGLKAYILSDKEILPPSSCYRLFVGCSSLQEINLNNFSAIAVVNMDSMFYYLKSLTNITFGDNFNTCNVTTMYRMFYRCSGLTSLDVSSFNTSKVTNMSDMFNSCQALTSLDLTKFITSEVTNMSSMFRDCRALSSLDVSSFNTSNVTNMKSMFALCENLEELDVSNFDTTSAIDISCMFELGSTTLSSSDGSHTFDSKIKMLKIPSNLINSTTINASSLFFGCKGITTLDVSGFDTSNVTDMESMFAYCESLTSLDLSSFNTGRVTNMSTMFQACFKLETIYVGTDWNTSSVTDGSYAFFNCLKLVGGSGTVYSNSHRDVTYAHIDGGAANPGYLSTKSDLTLATIKNLPSTITEITFNTFGNCLSDVAGFTETLLGDHIALYVNSDSTKAYILSNGLTVFPKSSSGMFSNRSTLLTINFINVDTSKVTDMANMFYYCSGLTSLDLSSFNTANVENMYNMFSQCSGLTSLNVASFNTSNVTNMCCMFNRCLNLTELNVSNFNTGNATNMAAMFSYCEKLTSLDVSNFDTSNVTTMDSMFSVLRGLTELDLSSFNTSKVTNMSAMFEHSYNIITIYVGSDWSTDSVTLSSNMFNNCTSLVGYDSTKTDATYATTSGYLTLKS